MKRIPLAILFTFLTVAALSAAKLDMWAIDVEGGKSLLILSPSGQSLLIDTGFPGSNDRDTTRILEACQAAGVKKIDILVTSHYDVDHVGNVASFAAKMPVDLFVDHGPASVTDRMTTANVQAYNELWAKAKHMVVKPGDKIPFNGVDVLVVTSNGEALKTPLPGAGKPNPACAGVQPMTWTRTNEDDSENGHAIGLLFTFGKFRMVDFADLTWNRELQLMCPNDPLPTVDLFMVSHHGNDISNSPALVNAAARACLGDGQRSAQDRRRVGDEDPQRRPRNAGRVSAALVRQRSQRQPAQRVHRQPPGFARRQVHQGVRRGYRRHHRHQRPNRGVQDL